jgi:diketogulonate reductase-like aldo/keto reductase
LEIRVNNKRRRIIQCACRLNYFAILSSFSIPTIGPDCDSIQGQWMSFQDMYQQGLTKSLSVSNFSPAQLDCILQSNKLTNKTPVVNQLPYSVAYHPGNAIVENQERGILVQAWAPLGGSLGGRFNSNIKSTCGQIGKRYNKSFAQVGSWSDKSYHRRVSRMF